MRREISEMVAHLLTAHQSGQPTPLLSHHYPDLDVKAAYEVQQAYVRRRLAHDRMAGLKAGLTSEAGQKRMGMEAPVAAVLLASGRRDGQPVIDRSVFRRLQVETEVGFVMGHSVSHAIPSMAKLREVVRAIMPAIELPELGFADRTKLTGRDLVAANGGAAQFIVGPETPAPPAGGDPLAMTLASDGHVLSQWRGALEDQWKVALWLVNTMAEQGWVLEAGHIATFH